MLASIASILIMLVTSNISAIPMDEKLYHVEDEEGDVVYGGLFSLNLRKGKQIEDIDILELDGYLDDGYMNITLVVKGRIRTDDEYDYYITGDLDPFDERGYDLDVSLRYGYTSVMFYNNYTNIRLDNSSTVNGSYWNISIPYSDERYDRFHNLSATAYYFDRSKLRSYMDDTEGIDEYAKDEDRRLSLWIALVILIVGCSAIAYVAFGRKHFKIIRIGRKKKCQTCGVIFTSKVKWCPYCDESLDQ
jgi:hypothetical protein